MYRSVISLIFQHCKVSDFLSYMQVILQFICKQTRKTYMFFGIPHKPMSCDMRTLLSCLHHAPNTPSFALFCSYRSHQQRSKRALQTVVLHCNTPCTPFRVFSWTKDTHPPLCRYIREHPSSPEFF